MSVSRNQIIFLDIRPTINSIIKNVRNKTFKPAIILARLLSEAFPRLRRDAFDLFASSGLAGSAEEQIARELLSILNKKSSDPKYNPIKTAIICLNANSEKLKSARKICVVLSGFFSVYVHYRHFLSANTQECIPYCDAWQQELTHQVSLITENLRGFRNPETAAAINSIVNLSLYTPAESRVLDEGIEGIIFLLETPSVEVYEAIHQLKSRIPAARLPYIINKLWDARKYANVVIVKTGLEILSDFIGQASQEKIREIVAELRTLIGIQNSAEIRLSAMRSLKHCLKHLMLGSTLDIIELLLQRMTQDESMDVRREASECIVTFAELIENDGLTPYIQLLLQLLNSNEANKASQVPEILRNLYKIANEQDRNQIERTLIQAANNTHTDPLVRQASLQTLMHLVDIGSRGFHHDLMLCYLRCMNDDNSLVSNAACYAINVKHSCVDKQRIMAPVSALVTDFFAAEDEQSRLKILNKLSLLTKLLSQQDVHKIIQLIIEKIISAKGVVKEEDKKIYHIALKNIFNGISQEDYHIYMQRVFNIILKNDYAEKCRIDFAQFALQCFGEREYNQSCCDVKAFLGLLTNKATPPKLIPIILEMITIVKGFAESLDVDSLKELRDFALKSILSDDEQLCRYAYLLLTTKFNRFATDDCVVINEFLSKAPNLTLAKKVELLVNFQKQLSAENFDHFIHSILSAFSDNGWLYVGKNEREDAYQALHLCVSCMSLNQKIILLSQLNHLLVNDRFQLELKPLFVHVYFAYKQDIAAILLQKSSMTCGQVLPPEIVRSVMSYTM